MKKVKILKKLKADVETFERLPIENCQVTNTETGDGTEEGLHKADIDGLSCRGRPFIDGVGLGWSRCFEVIERDPREVDEGVQVLPPNKPYLAYLGNGDDRLLKATGDNACPSLWLLAGGSWDSNHGCGWSGDGSSNKYALNVSTDWAKKHYPEFVEAMGYRPIYNPRDGSLKGHELDGKFYDLNWKPVEQTEPEPPEYKYETAIDVRSEKLDLRGYDWDSFKAGFKAARKLKEVPNEG